MYDICTWVYVFTCMWVHMYLWYFWVEAQGWYWKSSLVVLPLYSFKTGSLDEPGAHQSQQVSSQFAPGIPSPPSEAGIAARYHVHLPFPWGSGIWTFHLLACRNLSCWVLLPPLHFLSQGGSTYPSSPNWKPGAVLAVHSERVTPGIYSGSCPFATLEYRAWI